MNSKSSNFARPGAVRVQIACAVSIGLFGLAACNRDDGDTGTNYVPPAELAGATGTTQGPTTAAPGEQQPGSSAQANGPSDAADAADGATPGDGAGADVEDGAGASDVDDGSNASAAGEGGAAGAAGGEQAPGTPDEVMDLGVGDGSDVVTIGDSWMSYALNRGGIEGALSRADKDYRNYGVAGTTLSGSIPGQYDRAKRDDPDIATVIMTGGGNDIMFSGACNTSEGCADAVQMIVDNLDALWTTMADDGVQDVIYIAYAEDAGTTPQDTRPDEAPSVPSICLSGRIRCHSLQTTDLVMGSLVDGIHPTSAANDRIAEALLQLMEEGGVRR